MTPLETHRRQIATLRWYYRGLLDPALRWVACARCGALYPDPQDMYDCHTCPLAAGMAGAY